MIYIYVNIYHLLYILIEDDISHIYIYILIEDYITSYPTNTNFINCMDVTNYNYFSQWENCEFRYVYIYVQVCLYMYKCVYIYRLRELHIDTFDGTLLNVQEWVQYYEDSIDTLTKVIHEYNLNITHIDAHTLILQYELPSRPRVPLVRHTIPKDIKFYKSIQLFVLSREFIKYVCLYVCY